MLTKMIDKAISFFYNLFRRQQAQKTPTDTPHPTEIVDCSAVVKAKLKRERRKERNIRWLESGMFDNDIKRYAYN